MAELEIDQSNLPRVQEVCQCFAVLEDGVLAHNLQEQEIEQYYTTNIQKNQLVQNDIRIAKRLQDEEEEQQAQQSALLRQTSKQLEEQDFEYARIIQEELQRCAEEAHRREQDDEEMAKQMQEEEEQKIRRGSRGQDSHSEGSVSDPTLPCPHQHTLHSLHQGEEHYSSTTTRWKYSTSDNNSVRRRPKAVSPRRLAAQKNTTSWSNQGHTDSIRHTRSGLSEDSEDSDTVFSEQLSFWSQRLSERLNTAPPRRRASLRHPQERNYRSFCSRSSFTDESREWVEARGVWDEGYYENGDLERRRPRNRDQERSHREGNDGCHRKRDQDKDSRLVGVRERQSSLNESARLNDRRRHSNRDLARTWSYRDNPDKHVRFEEDTQHSDRRQDESSQVWEMLGQVLRERGVPVRVGNNGVPLQILPQSRDSQVLHGSEVSCSDTQPHQRVFQRAATTRHSFHGDIRERRRSSHREHSGKDHREDQDGHRDNVEHDGDENSSRESYAHWDRQGSRRWREHRCANDYARERNTNNSRVKNATSKHRHSPKTIEERLSSEEEVEKQEVERRVQRPRRRAPQHSQSFSSNGASTRDRSRHVAAGVSQQPKLDESSLDLGNLQQVLRDEELARKLQEEEQKFLRAPSSRSSYQEGDFRVAQVAQDEEIARFMQKQEIKSTRRSRELEGPASWREHRAMITQHDRRATRERQVQRERLDSEGLPSPTEDCSLENQPSSPVFSIPQGQQIRNIAEELDPTFQARRQDTESLQVAQTVPTCQSLPVSHSPIYDLEEPTFIPPTKRQTEKSGRTKSKEKKENCKQQ
ncbi:coiled-coil domain-containing protein 187 isoform X2 [Anabas testudineus]|uniref:Coiled-coil domain-containing protein n=1 Tax=Anabas testudineus TaxID=64144 RepID=A0A3Q1JSS0_ANATE|nr:coiled-coil domain-containing protein 187 isoform X2 [Anabas testudineus]